MVGVFLGAGAGMRASVWVNFVPMEACLILGPQNRGLEAQAWVLFCESMWPRGQECGTGERQTHPCCWRK